MRKEYTAPELQLAGEADQVIFGAGSGGFDFDSEIVFCDPPFQDDDPSAR